MKTKIPCGGFYLDDSLMLNEDNNLAVAGTHDSLTVKFRHNDEPDAGSDEYLCDTPLEKILEAVFVRKIPVNGLVFYSELGAFWASLSYCGHAEGGIKCVFSSSPFVYEETISGGNYIINSIGFEILELTSRSVNSNNILFSSFFFYSLLSLHIELVLDLNFFQVANFLHFSFPTVFKYIVSALIIILNIYSDSTLKMKKL